MLKLIYRKSACYLTVELFQQIWTGGGGDKPILRDWRLPRESTKFKVKFDEIQGQLEELCGRDDLLTGVLSKSKGQILRLAAVFNALFSLDPSHPLSNHLSDKAVEAAVNFVETCNEHTAIIGGRATVTDPLSRELTGFLKCIRSILNSFFPKL